MAHSSGRRGSGASRRQPPRSGQNGGSVNHSPYGAASGGSSYPPYSQQGQQTYAGGTNAGGLTPAQKKARLQRKKEILRRRRKHLPAAAEREYLLEKCRRICAVKVNPERFRVALGIKMMRSAAVHQSDLSTLGAVELVGLEVHFTRANVGQKEILVAFQMGDVAAVEKIIPRIVVIMSHAGDIVKQPPSGRRRR